MRSPGAPSVPAIAPRFPGRPSLTMSTADAPAACALRALTLIRQVPRCTSATSPSRRAAKSRARQPASEAPVIARTGPVARPPAEYASVRASRPAASLRPPRSVTRGARRSSKYGKRTGCTVTRHPAARSASTTCARVASSPGVPAARVPVSRAAVARASRCGVMSPASIAAGACAGRRGRRRGALAAPARR